MSQNLATLVLGVASLIILTVFFLIRFRERRLKSKNWEEDRILLSLLLTQSIIVITSIIINSVFRPISYLLITIENIINFIIFFIVFIEGFYKKKILSMITSIMLLILFLVSY